MKHHGGWLLAPALVVGAYLVYTLTKPSPPPVAHSTNVTSSQTTVPAQRSSSTTPDTEVAPVTERVAAPEPSNTVVVLPKSIAGDVGGGVPWTPSEPRFDVTRMGHAAIDDGDFNAILAELRADPAMLSALLEEYRTLDDRRRAMRLAGLLESFDDPRIIELGRELVYSGSIESQRAGFELLGDQQVRHPEARRIIEDVLSNETDPIVLSAAMNALATPANVDESTRQRLLDQFSAFGNSPDPAVRRLSLALTARWAADVDVNDYYLAGLADTDERVRTEAVLALMSTPHPDGTVRQALIGVVENAAENMRLRQNALVGLERHALSPTERQRLQSLLAGG